MILPELATFKRLANGIGDLQKQYLNSGDADSAVNLAQMGMTSWQIKLIAETAENISSINLSAWQLKIHCLASNWIQIPVMIFLAAKLPIKFCRK